MQLLKKAHLLLKNLRKEGEEMNYAPEKTNLYAIS